MSNNICLDDGITDEAKTQFHNRVNRLAKISIDVVFDYLESHVKEFPDMIKHLRNNQDIEENVEKLWSAVLFEERLIPKGYSNLPNKLLVANFHQMGYLEGLHVGYILAMMALVDNGVTKEMTLAIRDYIRPNLIGHHFDDRNEFIHEYMDEKYSWIEKE